MEENRKQKLMDAGAEALAQGLLELSELLEEADDLVERLIAGPEERVQRFKKKLASIKRSRRFIYRRDTLAFSVELTMLLGELRSPAIEPASGLEQVGKFYEADGRIYDRCDDSDGYVGQVFREHAKQLFDHFAARCEDQQKVIKLLLKLCAKNEYGLRDTLLDHVTDYVPEAMLRKSIASLQKRAAKAEGRFGKSDYLGQVETIARQLKDAKLFEETRIAWQGTLSTSSHIDIARVYLECGEPATAYRWLLHIPAGETFMAPEREELLLDLYRAQGETDKLSALLFRQFQQVHSLDRLDRLLAVIGEDQRAKVLSEEIANIMASDHILLRDAVFLTEVQAIDQAAHYLLQRAAKLDGADYTFLLTLAKTFAKHERPLVTSILYRSLLSSILDRKVARAYQHGVRYLRTLDTLAEQIIDWQDFASHDQYKTQLQQAHNLKRSFWGNYDQ